MSRTTYRAIVVGLAITVVLNTTRPAFAQGEPQIEKVFADWKARQLRTTTVYCQVDGMRVMPAGSYPVKSGEAKPAQPIPPREITEKVAKLFYVNVTTGKCRLEIEREVYDLKSDKLYPSMVIRTFDGKKTTAYRPREKNTHPTKGINDKQADIGIMSGDIKGAVLEVSHWPLFYGLGIVPTRLTSININNFRVLPEPDLLTVHGRAVHAGSSCLVLRTRPKGSFEACDEIWVDTDKESAIVRLAFLTGNRTTSEILIQHQQTDNGWMPKSWSYRQYQRTDEQALLSVEEMTISKMEFSQPLDESFFQIEEKPGQWVKVKEVKSEKESKTTSYQIQQDGSRKELAPASEGRYSIPNPWVWFMGVFATVLLAGSLLWKFLRTNRSKREYF